MYCENIKPTLATLGTNTNRIWCYRFILMMHVINLTIFFFKLLEEWNLYLHAWRVAANLCVLLAEITRCTCRHVLQLTFWNNCLKKEVFLKVRNDWEGNLHNNVHICKSCTCAVLHCHFFFVSFSYFLSFLRGLIIRSRDYKARI